MNDLNEKHAMFKKLFVLNVLNVLDLFLTVWSISTGYAYEVNPWMNYLMQTDFNLFVTLKLLLPLISSSIFFLARAKKLAWAAVNFLLITYSIILLIHLFNLGAIAYVISR